MKIVYLHQYFTTPDMPGGTRSFEMARRWAAAGHEVHVITSSRSGPARKGWVTTDVEGAQVHWRHVPYDNAMGFLSRLRAFATYAVTAGPRARALRADVVFATSTPLTVIVPALYATWRRHAPIVFEVRDLWPEMPIATGHLRHPALKCLASALEGVAYRSARRIVALSEGIAAGVRRRGIPAGKIVVAPNSCDVDVFDVPASVGERYRADRAWLGQRPFVVYCGTLGALNRVEYLVRLAGRMKAEHPDVVFGIYGTGADAERTRAVAVELGVLGDSVFLLGQIPKKEIPAVLSAATVVASVFLPIQEMEANSANKFFDGLAASRPVVVNYGGWQAELLRASDAGLVLDPEDIPAAATELGTFLHDAVRLDAARTAARGLGRERFSRDAISGLVLDTIEEAVGAGR